MSCPIDYYSYFFFFSFYDRYIRKLKRYTIRKILRIIALDAYGIFVNRLYQRNYFILCLPLPHVVFIRPTTTLYLPDWRMGIVISYRHYSLYYYMIFIFHVNYKLLYQIDKPLGFKRK